MEGITETRDALVKDVDQLKNDVAKIANDAKAHANAHVEKVRASFNDTLTSAQAQLAAHPFAVLGVGMLLGYIFGRRRRHRG